MKKPVPPTAMLLIVALLVGACSDSSFSADAEGKSPEPGAATGGAGAKKASTAAQAGNADAEVGSPSDYKTIEWTDLIPEEDLQALLNPPAWIDEIEDGSEEDKLDPNRAGAELKDDPYQQALSSTKIIDSFNKQRVRIPGFIVPLEFDEEQKITQFFIVPFFGACLHLPPPPPNQIIFAKFAKGLQVDVLYDPFWVSGKLQTTLVENDTATAAYAMDVVAIEPYEE